MSFGINRCAVFVMRRGRKKSVMIELLNETNL